MIQYVFLVGTEHQMFQVNAAIEKFNINANQITLIIEDMGDKAFIKKVEKKNYKEILVFKNWVFKDIFLNSQRHRSYIKYCKSLKDKSSEIIFLASHYDSDNTLLFLSIVKPSLFYLMDEGTANLATSYKRSKHDNRAILFLIKSLLYRQIINIPKELIYFTKYNFDIRIKDKIEKYTINKFNNPLCSFNEDQFFFLGTCIAEGGHIEEEKYLSLLQEIYNRMEEKECYYYPHRKEDGSKLLKVEAMGFKVIKINEPFESMFSNLKKCPGTIGSFFCTTVLDNISTSNYKIPKLMIYKFDIDFLQKGREIYERVYAHLLSNEALTFNEI